MIRFICPGCGKRLKADPEHAGKTVRCQTCSQTMVVNVLEGLDLEEPVEVVPVGAHHAAVSHGVHHTSRVFWKKAGDTTFGCYSKRGIVSYYLFRVLPYYLPQMLHKFGKQKESSSLANVERQDIKDVTVFSEMRFGKNGFGTLEGAVFCRLRQTPCLLLLDLRPDETYRKSWWGVSYEDTIQGQIELKWRMLKLFKDGRVHHHDGSPFIEETAEMRDHYAALDHYYHPSPDQDDPSTPAFRRLGLVGGLKDFFEDFVHHCELDNVFFLVSTGDRENPFTSASVPSALLPRFFQKSWEESRKQIYWLHSDFLDESPNV